MSRQKITQSEIIGIAINVFRKNGYHGTSMAMLAEACGLMKGSFYNHFKSKEDILIVAIQSMNDYLTERVFSIAYDNTIAITDRMKRILDKLKKVFRSDMGGCLAGNMTLELFISHPEFGEYINEYFEDWAKAFTVIYKSKYSPKRSRLLALQSIQEIEGAIMLGRIYDDELLLDQTFKTILSRL